MRSDLLSMASETGDVLAYESWEQPHIDSQIHPQTEISTSTSGAARKAQDKKHNIKTTESNRIAKKSYIVVCLLFESPKLLRAQMDIAHYILLTGDQPSHHEGLKFEGDHPPVCRLGELHIQPVDGRGAIHL
ncbi:hypothetical protein PGT21_035640 [Puccinia graminis f. sp. tritici]|uniref:Uncharacterized protein n=1 Tax=Puccinia graminis f. sp. tritici TaxID=56615 RepID=A0A5B0QCM9_PUCGR|nr:hypothetical protein PGT21_035640 [Puccinia graminis f. sp. tritici]